MSTLNFSPMTCSAVARADNPFVCYSLCPLIDLYTLSVGVDGECTQLGTFRTIHHAAVAAMEHWQEFEERIKSGITGLPSKGWATLPKTTVVPAEEIRRNVNAHMADAAMEVQHDIGGEA